MADGEVDKVIESLGAKIENLSREGTSLILALKEADPHRASEFLASLLKARQALFRLRR